jgi:hypothetical protein
VNLNQWESHAICILRNWVSSLLIYCDYFSLHEPPLMVKYQWNNLKGRHTYTALLPSRWSHATASNSGPISRTAYGADVVTSTITSSRLTIERFTLVVWQSWVPKFHLLRRSPVNLLDHVSFWDNSGWMNLPFKL